MNQTPLSYGDAKAHLKKILKTEWERFRSQNPQFSTSELKVETCIYKKRPPGYSKVYLDIMERLLWRGCADKTQQAILAEIRPLHPTQNIVANIWNKPLKKKQLEAMKTMIGGGDRRTSSVNIAGCRTLAEIKERIRAHIHSAEAVQTFKGTIAIDSTSVIVGKKAYTITHRSTGKYQYPAIRITVGNKRPWVRVDMLTALLEK